MKYYSPAFSKLFSFQFSTIFYVWWGEGGVDQPSKQPLEHTVASDYYATFYNKYHGIKYQKKTDLLN